jgi:hypothetical protein
LDPCLRSLRCLCLGGMSQELRLGDEMGSLRLHRLLLRSLRVSLRLRADRADLCARLGVPVPD